MKTFKLTGIGMMEMIEVPDPVITGPKDVLIRMKVLGICGSDIHYYTQGNIGSQKVVYPFAVGHEGAGIVAGVGSGVKTVKQGDIVAIEPAMPCFECDQCRAGRHHTCRKLRFLGCPGQAEGCLSEYIVMPETSCFPLPAVLNADHGSISEPLAIGVYSVSQAGDVSGRDIAILGFGPIGMSVMLAAGAEGATGICVTDMIEERLGIAVREGARLTGNPGREDIVSKFTGSVKTGFDYVFECCGKQDALDEALRLLKPGGKLIVVGIPEFDSWTLNAETARRREISIIFIRRQNGCVETSIEMMASGKIATDRMVTHRFPFSKAKEAFDLVAGYRDGVMKAMIDF
ncbi:MAG: alcohol dehydrogenase catalytic domain-containing protein [Bacteroidales bacterium]|nr:alcohol dehydrogenase catalytic domain-containing protein [Bacteroidales bacterium]MCU0408723.1 alcohol dehydrogenase catalytic domain-containing protein [Bacteroidales bacterium]